jgi:hypothetical protein
MIYVAALRRLSGDFERQTDGCVQNRFIDNEIWRKEFGTDDLPRTFEYTEKAQVFEYYPQYYHKTDKVS